LSILFIFFFGVSLKSALTPHHNQ